VVRERLLEPRLDLARELLARDDFFAPALLDLRAPLFAPLLREADERLLAAPDDFARDVLFLARVPDERDLLDALDLRDDFARPPLDLRVLPRPEPDDPELAPKEPSSLHLPDITRCAASATASATIEPNLVALAMTLVAACDAVSAASSPASRIARRAFGLALIAAAAAARPAASISLLIAALASLSAVLLPDLEEEVREADPEVDRVALEDVFLADFAMDQFPPSRERHFKAVTVPKWAALARE
jgi:hypothetical protein